MKALILDIETAPHENAKERILMPKPPKNYQTPDAIFTWTEEKKKDLVKAAALNPSTARVIAIGIIDDEGENPNTHILRKDEWNDIEEAKLLTSAWLILTNRVNNCHIVTFNGHKFDFDMMIKRSWVLDVEVPSWIPSGTEYYNNRHWVDLLEHWQRKDRGKSISLDNLGVFFGMEKKEHAGDAFAGFVAAGEMETAKKYLDYDLEITRTAYNKMQIRTPKPAGSGMSY